MTSRFWLRFGLWFLTVLQVVVGCWQLFLPHSFYADGPLPGHHWVDLLPPYNEHLMRDVGALTLALAVPFAAAAVTLDRRLARVALVASLVFTVSHFIFHATHLEHFPTGEAVGQTITLGVTVLIPVALLLLTARVRGPAVAAR